MLPTAAALRPDADNIAAAINVVVVLPSVPVIATIGRGRPLACSARYANSISDTSSICARSALAIAEERAALEERSEHWRLLYVAMTRAEEMLIVAGVTKKPDLSVPETSWHSAAAMAAMTTVWHVRDGRLNTTEDGA